MENMTKNHPGGHFHNCCDFEKLHRHRPLTSPLPNRSHRISDLMQLRFVDDLRIELLFRATLGDIGCEPTPENLEGTTSILRLREKGQAAGKTFVPQLLS